MKLFIERFRNIQISRKDKRALMLGLAAVFAIFLFMVLDPAFGKWGSARVKTAANLRSIQNAADIGGKTRIQGILSVVPVFEMPKDRQNQMMLFSNKINEQFKQSGINPTNLQYVSVAKTKEKKLQLQCKAICVMDQALDFLSKLKQNPYYVAIDQLSLKVDEKDRNKVDFTITVSTFSK